MLDIHLMKPARFLAEGQLVDRDSMLHNEDQAPSVAWAEYPYRNGTPHYSPNQILHGRNASNFI